MHAFILIIAMAGQPEKVAATCDTYRQCSDLGATVQALYCQQFNKQPRDISYRVLPAIKGK